MIEISTETSNFTDSCGNESVASLKINGTSIDLCMDCLEELQNEVTKFNNKLRCYKCKEFIMSKEGWHYGGSCKLWALKDGKEIDQRDAGYNYCVDSMSECKFNK